MNIQLPNVYLGEFVTSLDIWIKFLQDSQKYIKVLDKQIHITPNLLHKYYFYIFVLFSTGFSTVTESDSYGSLN